MRLLSCRAVCAGAERSTVCAGAERSSDSAVEREPPAIELHHRAAPTGPGAEVLEPALLDSSADVEIGQRGTCTRGSYQLVKMVAFKYSIKQLQGLVVESFNNTTADDVQKRMIPKFDGEMGGVKGLLKDLNVEPDQGISANEIIDRRTLYGENKVEPEPQDPLWKLMLEALKDPTLIFLTVAAFISLFIGIFIEQKPLGWLEGVAILSAVVVVVLVASINDYQKEKQFRDLNAKKDDVQITVVRGGQTETVSTHDLVVGDIVMLSTGDILPTDGVILGRNDLAINEKMLTGETVNKKKSPEFVISSNKVQSAPILFAGTQVQEGEGRMLVVAVGENTYQGHMEAKMAEAEKGRSILQKKLDNMTGESVGCRPLTVRHSLVHTGSARGLIRTRQASAGCRDATSLCL